MLSNVEALMRTEGIFLYIGDYGQVFGSGGPVEGKTAVTLEEALQAIEDSGQGGLIGKGPGFSALDDGSNNGNNGQGQGSTPSKKK